MNRDTTLSTAALTLERLPQVKARTGLSNSDIYRRIAAGDFPAPIKLGTRASAWSAAEVDSWITRRIEVRDAKVLADLKARGVTVTEHRARDAKAAT